MSPVPADAWSLAVSAGFVTEAERSPQHLRGLAADSHAHALELAAATGRAHAELAATGTTGTTLTNR